MLLSRGNPKRRAQGWGRVHITPEGEEMQNISEVHFNLRDGGKEEVRVHDFSQTPSSDVRKKKKTRFPVFNVTVSNFHTLFTSQKINSHNSLSILRVVCYSHTLNRCEHFYT